MVVHACSRVFMVVHWIKGIHNRCIFPTKKARPPKKACRKTFSLAEKLELETSRELDLTLAIERTIGGRYLSKRRIIRENVTACTASP